MSTPLGKKSSLEEIRSRFDADVERFSSLESGQRAIMDAPLVLELLAQLAPHWLGEGSQVLDLGCGAGNYTLKLLETVNPLKCVLLDLSPSMLERAKSRVGAVNRGKTCTVEGDMGGVDLPDGRFDMIVTGAALHHLRDDGDWERMFRRMFGWLKPGGVLFVSDLVASEDPSLQRVLEARFAAHLEGLGGTAYRDTVLSYIDREDSPRSLPYQFELLRRCGFGYPEVIHRYSVFATYFARKPSERAQISGTP